MNNKKKAIQMAQEEMNLAGRNVVVTDVTPTEHPLAVNVWLNNGKKVEVNGLIAVRLKGALYGH